MNLSLNWLKRYIDFDLELEELSEILTDIGLEVEGLEKVETIKGGLKGIVVGYVEQCQKHPNADKLSLTKVNIGDLELKQIVCGAPNVAAGQKVLVATIGTTLYAADGEAWKIKKGKIRGEVSEGMICAEDELGLGADHSGIIVLPEDVPVGTLASDYYQIEDDYVFDIGLTPNRSDATSHLGVAKDLAAYLKINKGGTGLVKDPDRTHFKVDVDKPAMPVEIVNPEACPRYSGISLTGVEIGPSPSWMQNLLRAIGVRPISNVVDITNFVLHEYGQPLHAFDADKIKGGKIKVMKLPQDTGFVALDEKERQLHAEDLMICDAESNPLCIGGVFGGLHSGVTEGTTNIFLEAAHFEAGHIRRTSTRHLLRTDAAKVFEKGSDPNITIDALERAALLLQQYAGATIASEIVDAYPQVIEPKEIHVNYQRIQDAVGTPMERDEIHNILRAMEMELRPVDDNSFVAIVPTNKADVLREVDIIEEVLRIYGFNKVPIPAQLRTAITYQNYPTSRQVKNGLADYLASNGFNEMMGMSLIESGRYGAPSEEMVFINNTSNIHLDIMRPDALISGLKSVAHNLNYQQRDLRLFEYGRTYAKQEEGFKETEFLSLFITGADQPPSWQTSPAQADFYQLKQWVERVLLRVSIATYQVKEVEGEAFDFGLEYHRGPNSIVRFGQVSKQLLKRAEISVPVYFADFGLKTLIKGGKKSTVQVEEISKYPATERDLSLVLNKGVTFGEVMAVSKNTNKKLIKEVSLFDVYKNAEQLGEDKKAYAVKFKFQDISKTLTDKEVDKVMTALQENFKSKLGAEIRI
jgi:phenylalanyl-tRNA synthetase beta chain